MAKPADWSAVLETADGTLIHYVIYVDAVTFKRELRYRLLGEEKGTL